ncbi:PQ-loop-domain-containing protein [Hypoxylon rubiginosum]|uniref:PQ-loop-domain-containing protein n=1 Tax=Hypoxylon rubiginosum TaxID=110542 RepID=A0ACC0DJD2_9PEZI|nr:PQ-loop-domain-containing protein [Hypoxylon rubiginosum]
MAPPTGPLNLDVEAISGICGSISIAAWVVVFSPQIIENFRRGSADGLSVPFIILWLLGDVFNILGAVLQGVLPTMLILAIYYTIADFVLLAQCFYYKGFVWKDELPPPQPKPPRVPAVGEPTERTGLLNGHLDERERRGSGWSHLSPAVPLVSEAPVSPPPAPTKLQSIVWNAVAMLMVCVAGVLGWFLSRQYSPSKPDTPGDDSLPSFDVWGQIFGWLCAVLYLGSRLPQLLLNWRRKSTEGVSILFFLFACLGNLTYVLSIFAYDPHCAGSRCQSGEARRIYGRYILVNSSWLAGSLGTLILDLGIFAQFFIYSKDGSADEDDQAVEDALASPDERRIDDRPLLQRAGSGLP